MKQEWRIMEAQAILLQRGMQAMGWEPTREQCQELVAQSQGFATAEAARLAMEHHRETSLLGKLGPGLAQDKQDSLSRSS